MRITRSGHFSIVPAACGRCSWLVWILLLCLGGAALLGEVEVFETQLVCLCITYKFITCTRWCMWLFQNTFDGLCNIKEAICVRFREVVIFMTRAAQYGIPYVGTHAIFHQSCGRRVNKCSFRSASQQSSDFQSFKYMHNRSLLLGRGERAIMSRNLCS